MTSQTVFKMALKSIFKNKMRTALTMLGIVIGVGAVIVMVAIGNGAQAQIKSQISGLGTNLIVVTAGSVNTGGASQGAQSFNRLTVDDVDAIKREATLLSGVSPVIVTRTQVVGGTGNWRAEVNGVSTDFFAIRDWTTTSGDLFTEEDVRTKRTVVLLGATVAKNLFADGDPVGREIRLGKTPFTVVGVLASKGQTASGADQDDVVIVPYTTAQTPAQRLQLPRPDPRQRVVAGEPRAGAGGDQGHHARGARHPERRHGRLHRARPDGDRQGGDEHQLDHDVAARRDRVGVAHRRRDRDHEHHARLGHGAHARDRHPHGHRRARQ